MTKKIHTLESYTENRFYYLGRFLRKEHRAIKKEALERLQELRARAEVKKIMEESYSKILGARTPEEIMSAIRNGLKEKDFTQRKEIKQFLFGEAHLMLQELKERLSDEEVRLSAKKQFKERIEAFREAKRIKELKKTQEFKDYKKSITFLNTRDAER